MSYTPDNNQRPSSYERMQIPLHIGMGCVYIIFGILILYVKYFGSMELSAGLAYALGGLMLVYGTFRLWRGFSLLRKSNRKR